MYKIDNSMYLGIANGIGLAGSKNSMPGSLLLFTWIYDCPIHLNTLA